MQPTSQKVRIVSLDSGPTVLFIVTLPKYSPTIATAMSPEAPIPDANTYKPYTAQIVRINSAILSLMLELTALARIEITSPISIPPAMLYANPNVAEKIEIFERLSEESTIVKITIAVASLNAASVSRRAASFGGTSSSSKDLEHSHRVGRGDDGCKEERNLEGQSRNSE